MQKLIPAICEGDKTAKLCRMPLGKGASVTRSCSRAQRHFDICIMWEIQSGCPVIMGKKKCKIEMSVRTSCALIRGFGKGAPWSGDLEQNKSNRKPVDGGGPIKNGQRNKTQTTCSRGKSDCEMLVMIFCAHANIADLHNQGKSSQCTMIKGSRGSRSRDLARASAPRTFWICIIRKHQTVSMS